MELLVGEGYGPLKSHCMWPHEGRCLQKVIARCRSGQVLISTFVESCVEVENIQGRQPWTRSLAPSTVRYIYFLITVLSTVFRKERWRIVGAFFAGSVPRDR